PFLATFAEDAVMRFDNFPIGPFIGRSAIAEAYATQPPSATMALIGMKVLGTDAVTAASEWAAGGTGHMYLRFRGRQAAGLASEVGQIPEPQPGETTPSGP